MRLGGGLGQLTYCTNIHSGEGLDDVARALREHAVRVRARVSADHAFAVGLRLSGRAARELDEPAAFSAFCALLAELDLYVFTINGFPHGDFHGARVKEQVYLPDWRDEARLHYTDRLARLLARLLPSDQTFGSISTVPGGFKQVLSARDVEQVALRLGQHVAALVRLEQQTGRQIMLALEPEPGCMLETIAEAVTFFEEQLCSRRAIAALASTLGVSSQAARDALQRHVGVCLDLCHAAVEFEDPTACLRALEGAGIPVAKLQISAGLTLDPREPQARAALAPFRDERYLHQVVARHGGTLTRYVDLPDAEEAFARGRLADEWRVHFHVPIFHAELEALGTTQSFVRAVLAEHRRRPISPHLEVETYTWDVLPPALRDMPVHEGIARELCWVLGELRV